MVFPGDARRQTLASFDWQWAHLASGDFMPGDSWFDANATRVLTDELCAIDLTWFAGKRVLDAGCGQGRWTRSLLALGANVTAVDFSQTGLARTRALCVKTERLNCRQVDLLDLPTDLGDFDLVFSFGVLHHTGDTWRALANVSQLVRPTGALALYLYGANSWSTEEAKQIERLRKELAGLDFDGKIAELTRQFPGDDPHQLFDLMSPMINDRVTLPEVRARLEALGFAGVEQTIAGTEVYLRAIRPGFPRDALRPVVGENSAFRMEGSQRALVRRGAAFESSLRRVLDDVRPREVHPVVLTMLRSLDGGGTIIDLSLPPDQVPNGVLHQRTRRLAASDIVLNRAGCDEDQVRGIVHLGAGLGAGRFPERVLKCAWQRVVPGGWLAVEVVDAPFPAARRTFGDRIRDRSLSVFAKIASLLRRNYSWCTGEAISAVGGARLLNPLGTENAVGILTSTGEADVSVIASRPHAHLLIARRFLQ